MKRKHVNFLFFNLLVAQLPFFGHYLNFIIVLNVLLWSAFLFDFKLNKSVQLLILLGTFIGVLISYNTYKGLMPGLNLLSVFVSLKICEIHNKRDAVVFVGFSFILTIVNLMVEDKLFFIFLLLFQWAYSFYLLKRINFDLTSGPLSYRPFGLLFLTIPITVLLFVAFPRIGLGSFNFQNASTMKLGFTERLMPGEVSTAVQSKELIFRASFSSKKNRPLYSELYWIGSYMTQNDGLSWRPSAGGKQKQKTTGKGSTYKINYEHSRTMNLFYLEGSKQFRSSGTAKIDHFQDGGYKVVPLKGQRAVIEMNKGARQSYAYSPKELIKYLQFNRARVSPKVYQLAESLKGATAKETGNKILDYFSENFSYTLSPGQYSKENGIEEFLIERKQGFCGHFASGLALLLRINGVPSRVVTGFMGGTYNEYGDYYIITTEDSHAWVEYYQSGQGWIRLDPTIVVARERLEFGGPDFLYALINQLGPEYFKNKSGPNPFQKFQMAYDVVYYKLSDGFFNFDLERQFDIFKAYFRKSNPFILMVSLSVVFFVLGPVIYFIYLKVMGREKKNWEDRVFHKICKKFDLSIDDNEGLSEFAERVKAKDEFLSLIFILQELKYNPDASEDLKITFNKMAKNLLARS